MRETIFALIITLIISVTLTGFVYYGHTVESLEIEVVSLQNEIEQRKFLLEEAKTLARIADRPVVCIDYEYTVDEFLWHLEEIAANSECLEVH